MKIVIAGGGIIGLSTAMLLARDGHQVVVIERDPAPPGDPTAAWDDWEHRGVTQVRMASFIASFSVRLPLSTARMVAPKSRIR